MLAVGGLGNMVEFKIVVCSLLATCTLAIVHSEHHTKSTSCTSRHVRSEFYNQISRVSPEWCATETVVNETVLHCWTSAEDLPPPIYLKVITCSAIASVCVILVEVLLKYVKIQRCASIIVNYVPSARLSEWVV
jgi:hypothetical protein